MNKPLSIALLHGWATDPSIWDPVVSELESRGHSVTVYEMPGYGSRHSENGIVTLDQLVDDAIEKLEGCELWVGWSLGSMISIGAALRKSAQCKAVLAVSPTAKFCCDAEKESALNGLRDSVQSDAKKAVSRFRRAMASAENRRTVGKKISEMHSEIAGDRNTVNRETLLAGLEILSTTDLIEEVNKIDVPVRIVSGEEDTIIPCSSGEKLHQLIPNSTYTTLPCGHVPFLECPQRFMEQLFEFAKTITETTADSKPV